MPCAAATATSSNFCSFVMRQTASNPRAMIPESKKNASPILFGRQELIRENAGRRIPGVIRQKTRGDTSPIKVRLLPGGRIQKCERACRVTRNLAVEIGLFFSLSA